MIVLNREILEFAQNTGVKLKICILQLKLTWIGLVLRDRMWYTKRYLTSSFKVICARQELSARTYHPKRSIESKRWFCEPQYLRQEVAGPHKSPRPRIILLVKFSIFMIFMSSAELNSDNFSYNDFRMKSILQKCCIIWKDDFCGMFMFINHTLGLVEGLEHTPDLYLNLWDFRP